MYRVLKGFNFRTRVYRVLKGFKVFFAYVAVFWPKSQVIEGKLRGKTTNP